MDRDQLLQERQIGLGGTDCAAICGVSSFKSPLDVYYEKINGPAEYDNSTLKRGRRAERYILEEYAEHTGETLITDLPMLQDAKHPFLIGHVDARVQNQNIIIEAKSTRFNASTWKGTLPQIYLYQIAHYASISNADRVDIAVLFNNWEYGCFSYYRNEELEKQIKQTAIDFWHNHIIPKVPPLPTNMKDIIKTYPNSVECKEVVGNETIIKKVNDLALISKQMKILGQKEEDIKLEIMNYMQDAEKLNAAGLSVTWKHYTQNRLDTSKLKEERPEIYAQYLKTNDLRPLKLIERSGI